VLHDQKLQSFVANTQTDLLPLPLLLPCCSQEAASTRERCAKLDEEMTSLHAMLGSAATRNEVRGQAKPVLSLERRPFPQTRHQRRGGRGRVDEQTISLHVVLGSAATRNKVMASKACLES
jgi:hypothetical protein